MREITFMRYVYTCVLNVQHSFHYATSYHVCAPLALLQEGQPCQLPVHCLATALLPAGVQSTWSEQGSC